MSFKRLQRITVCGLGKLGACVAACLAARGFEVVGIDLEPSKVEALADGVAPVQEPKLQDTIDQGAGRLHATTSFDEAVETSQACFFVTPTPSLPDGSFTNEYLLKAMHEVATQVRRRQHSGFLFVINSTVTPGSCDAVVKPMLEQALGGKCGIDFGLCYNPEFIALGDVIRGMLEPDFVLIGESDEASGECLQALYQRFNTNAAPVERMSLASAELAKISVNCAVTMKISFANQLSAVCAKIPSADARAILRAIGKDRRIGLDYLKPGLGFGGPCFPRDNRLFQYTARSLGVEALLAEATDKVNDVVNARLLGTVLAHSPAGDPVGVLGLAYKPFTTVIDCSPGVWLSQQLTKRGRQVFAHDYLAATNALAALPNGRTQLCSNPGELFEKGCRTVAITCPWPDYRKFFDSEATRIMKPGSVIIDPWGVLEELAEKRKEISYITSLD